MKEIVRAGWDRLSSWYRPDGARSDIFGKTFAGHRRWLRPMLQGLAPGERVVDLGCGCGVPDAALLARKFDVTGIDLSAVQIRRARRLVPHAHFRRADMSSVRFPAESLGGVVCLYAMIHLPRGEHRALLARIRRWLRPGGLFLLITGRTAWTGRESDWLGTGVPMAWSHAGARTYARWLKELGFELLHHEMVPEPGGGGHALFLVRRPDDARPPRGPGRRR